MMPRVERKGHKKEFLKSKFLLQKKSHTMLTCIKKVDLDDFFRQQQVSVISVIPDDDRKLRIITQSKQ